jgi:hypothetical protein
MTGHSRRLCTVRWFGPPLALLLAMAFVTGGRAAWSAQGSGAGSGAALVMPSGNTPSAAVTSTDVTVRWPAATLPNGAPVGGYIVRRYDATTGGVQAAGPACDGSVTSTTCTEHNVPSGSWTYTDTPVLAGWSGGESSRSSPITVP